MDEYTNKYLDKYINQTQEERAKLRVELLSNIREEMSALKELLNTINEESTYEQMFYRYHYGSFKVYIIAQVYTSMVVEILEKLLPGRDLAPTFYSLIQKGTGKEFDISVNETWEEEPLQILNAFLHMRHILEMLVKYGETLEDPNSLPYGWATILLLYGLR